jgi:hypothetical protein
MTSRTMWWPSGVSRGVARVGEAVVRVDLVAVLHPDLLPAGQHQVGGEAQLGAGRLPDRGGRLEVPGEVAVVVADGVDDPAALLDDHREGPAQVVVRVEHVGRGAAGVGEHLHDVAGQDDGQRRRLGGEPAREHLAGATGDRGPLRRQVQVADSDHLAARRDGHF